MDQVTEQLWLVGYLRQQAENLSAEHGQQGRYEGKHRVRIHRFGLPPGASEMLVQDRLQIHSEKGGIGIEQVDDVRKEVLGLSRLESMEHKASGRHVPCLGDWLVFRLQNDIETASQAV